MPNKTAGALALTAAALLGPSELAAATAVAAALLGVTLASAVPAAVAAAEAKGRNGKSAWRLAVWRMLEGCWRVRGGRGGG